MQTHIKDIRCRICHGKPCEKKFKHPLWCQFVANENDKFAADILDDFYSKLTPFNRNIWYKDLIIFASNRIDFDKEMQRNQQIKSMVKIMAEVELNFKFSNAENELDMHYKETKKFYMNLFGETENDIYTIKIIYPNGSTERI
jgi:hypothetical protein